METHKIVTQFLDETGVDTMFAFQSDGNMEMLAYIEEEKTNDIRLIKTRHEQAAVAMADGFSRASENMCVCTVGRGPAIAQTGTSLVTSHRHGSNFLVLLPETSTNSYFDDKDFAQEAYLDATIENVISIRHQDTVVPSLRESFHQLENGDGPVAVQVARNVLDGDITISEDRDIIDQSKSANLRSPNHPNESQIIKAVDLYIDSDMTKAPIILAGRGAVKSGAHKAIEDLAEKMNAMLATTVQGRGYFDDHPFSLGFIGGFGRDLANEFTMKSDFVLAVGCSLNPHTTDRGSVLDDEKNIVHIDKDPKSIERHTPVDIGIIGDATKSIEAFTRELESREITQREELWSDSIHQRINNSPKFDDGKFPQKANKIDPRELIREANQILPENRIVVSDTGHHNRWVLDGLDTPSPEDFIWPSEFSSIGLGIPTGIGAALASKKKTCITVCGDAGFMMTDHAIETAARYEIPIIVLVMNDCSLGTEYHTLNQNNKYADVSLIDTPDIANVASAMGAKGVTIRSVSDVYDQEELFNQSPEGPVVVDCKINREVVHRSKR